MTKTEYLALNKPSDSDYVDINPLNANCDVIDSFAKSAETDIDNLNNAVADIAKDVSDISGAIEDKADKAAVDSLSEDVGTLEEELENKADKSELEDKADKSELEGKADKSELAALSEVVSGKADASEITRIDGAIADKADKSELGSYAKKTDLNAYATSEQLQAASTTLDTKIDAVSSRTKEDLSELSESIVEIEDDISNVTVVEKSKNIFNIATVTLNTKLNKDGTTSEQTNMSCSDYIDVSSGIGKTIYFSHGTTRVESAMQDIVFYTKDKNTVVQAYIGAWKRNVVVPNGAYWMRFTITNVNIQNRMMAEYDTKLGEYQEWFSDRISLINQADVNRLLEEYNSLSMCQSSTRYIFAKLPLMSGKETNVFHENLVDGSGKLFLGINSGNGINHDDCFSFTPTDASNISAIYYSVYKDLQKNKSTSFTIPSVTVKTTDGTNKDIKVMLIGDSFTAMGKYQKFVNDYFQSDSTNVEWVGSITTSSGLKCEGRSGWRAWTYCNCMTGAEDTSGLGGTNAFMNPSTNEFDFGYYMNEQGFSGVDVVFINLGTNDLARVTHSTVEEVLSSYNTMIDSIKAYNSNIKIVLWIPCMPCILNGIGSVASSIYRRYLIKNMLLDNFAKTTWGTNNIWVLPSNLVIDPMWDFPMIEQERNSANPNKRWVCTDTTHLSDIGWEHLSVPIIAMIKYLASLS